MRVEEKEGADSGAIIAPLAAAVYPPDVIETIVWKNVTFAQPARRIIVYDDDDPVSTAGILFRTVLLNGAPTLIAGVGSVMTRPAAQRTGFGRAAMLAAHEIINREPHCSFGLLFCEPNNFEFYRRLGWSLFDGAILAEQPGWNGEYAVTQPMVRQVTQPAPIEGIIDLQGLPW